MRVLMLTQSYPPIIGGEEQHVWNLSTALAARGHDVAVATLAMNGAAEFEVERGVRVYRLGSTVGRVSRLSGNGRRVHAPPLPDPEICWALRRIVAEEQPHIVHAHNWLVHSFLPLKSRWGPKLVLSLHDYSLACATKKLLHLGEPCPGPSPIRCPGCAADHYGWTKGIATLFANSGMSMAERRLVDLFIPVSRAVAAGNGLLETSAPVRIIPNFLTEYSSIEEPGIAPYLHELPREPYFLFVGAFAAYKGVDVLLSAYTDLCDAPPLVIIGYQTEEYPVSTPRIPRGVTLVKDWPHSAVMEAWRNSLVGLVPSTWGEPFGLVALEAMVMGRPVIATAVGGLQEIVKDGETGLVVKPGDPVALRDAMQRLLHDKSLRENLGRAAKQRVASFEARVVVPQIEEAYDDLVRTNGTRS